MRVALCLSGTARWFTDTAVSIKRFLIEPFNSDVFIHTYYPFNEGFHVPQGKVEGVWPYGVRWDAREEFVDTMKETYNPVSLVVQDFDKEVLPFLPVEPYETDKKLYGRDRVRGDVVPTLSQWYKIREVSKLKQEYETTNGMKYDVVIRARSDLWMIRFNVDLMSMPKGTVCEAIRDGWGSGVNTDNGTIYMGYLDNMAWGDSPTMDYWMSSFDHFAEHYNEGCLFNSEYFLRRHIDKAHIPVKVYDAEFRFYGRGIKDVPE